MEEGGRVCTNWDGEEGTMRGVLAGGVGDEEADGEDGGADVQGWGEGWEDWEQFGAG